MDVLWERCAGIDIGRLDERVDSLMATATSEGGVPVARARDHLDTMPGVGKRAA